MPSGFLERWVDAGLVLTEGETRESLIATERARLARAAAVAAAALEIPRRVQGDDSELALDKKRARRVLAALTRTFVSWGGEPRVPDSDERKEGATLAWETWVAAHSSAVEARLRYLATYAYRQADPEWRLWGRSAVVKLMNELVWLEYAMRS